MNNLDGTSAALEAALLSLLPCLMWLGFALRLYKHWLDEDYAFSLKSPDGKTNIKKSIFNGIVVAVFFTFALIVKADDNINTDTVEGTLILVGWIVKYLFWGWSIDSVFLWLMDKWESKMKSII